MRTETQMKANTQKLLTVSAIYFSMSVALAADVTASASGTRVATSDTTVAAAATVPARRIANRFANLAGSPENAASLVAGMRSGSVITLGSTASTSGISFTPATGQMGYGNVTRALSLAQLQLAAQGIVEPTPEQLRTALNGGTLTTVDSSGAAHRVEMAGVLQLRSQGMGWGQIAHQLSVTPSNRPSPLPPNAAGQARSAYADVDLRGSIHGQGVIVSGDGSILHGRTPGYGAVAQGNAVAESRAAVQANSAMQAQSGRPSFVGVRSAVGLGNSGKTAAAYKP